jgi:hypothetical protein
MKKYLFFIVLTGSVLLFSQTSLDLDDAKSGSIYELYPLQYDNKPDVASPFFLNDSTEVVLVCLKNGKYALIDITVENGKPLHYSRRLGSFYGKDQQLMIDAGNFPHLAKTGLHSEPDLDQKTMISGMPLSLITYIGQPERFSWAGFMAEDEDIISVLKADNQRVKRMGFTHPQMARPLFHVWNIILKEIELGKLTRFYDNIRTIYYNARTIDFKAEATKGWQVSIFQDEIQGRFDITVTCAFSPEERSLLKQKYAHLSAKEIAELEKKLSAIHFSEMAPYYIMRYGFYEGHTSYRSDPIAIAFIFGLKSLPEIEAAFKGNLYEILLSHFNGMFE